MTARARSAVLPLLAALAVAPPAVAAKRQLAIVVDTSGSMQSADPQRYTMQVSQVLSDLLDDGDEVSVIRMPPGVFASCSAGASSSLVLQLDALNRADFKRRLDGVITFDTGTHFAAPIRTAVSLLQRDGSAQRMLLVIADSGGLGVCEDVLTQELLGLKRGGVTVAAINIGSSSGAFDGNPAFDFTTAALHAQGLIEAVALVYQRFLGAKQVQTGEVAGEIEVEIAPYVDEAFLVVAADGPITAIEPLAGNPGAVAIDANHRGGGQTLGLDRVLRGYRIVRLQRPSPGRWRFRTAGVAHRGGWMLLQDSAVGARLVSPPVVPRGAAVPLEVELFDQRTGARIADSSRIPGLQTELEIDGRRVALRDDGTGGDRQAGDGILTATTIFDRTGDQPLAVHLQSNFLDRRIALRTNVVDATWRLDVRTPQRAEIDRPIVVAVALQPVGAAEMLRPPERIDVLTGGAAIELRDDGKSGDRQAGDRIFAREWTPPKTGRIHLDYKSFGGSTAVPARGAIDVVGRLRFGAPVPVRLGRLGSEAIGDGRLDLSSADVRGEVEIAVSTSFERARSVFEIDFGSGWVALGRDAQTLRLVDGGSRAWPLRLRVGECPEGHPPNARFDIVVSASAPDGRLMRTTVPVTVEIVPDPWLHCWWPVLAAAAGAIVAGIAVHGYWSPSRFPPRLGVMLSPEEDIGEGFLHPICAQRGSSSGFYRDARIYVCDDFRLAGKARNAVARLRAERRQVRIAPAGSNAVWRRTSEGAWEQIPPGESTARFGDLYRNDHSSLFFELRNT
ncbi:MAG TPA: VWA domain-containing protein [Thermoanaerobaculia bacterium]|jgi:hypothetical protein